MVALRHRNLKLFAVALAFFAITITSFLLNFTQNSEKYFRFSGPFVRFIASMRRPCGCETCVSEAELSPWFDERFNQTVLPFLTKQNNLLSESTYKWWLVSAVIGFGAYKCTCRVSPPLGPCFIVRPYLRYNMHSHIIHL